MKLNLLNNKQVVMEFKDLKKGDGFTIPQLNKYFYIKIELTEDGDNVLNLNTLQTAYMELDEDCMVYDIETILTPRLCEMVK